MPSESGKTGVRRLPGGGVAAAVLRLLIPGGFRRLGLLQKSLVVSILLHVLLVMIFAGVPLSKAVVEYVARGIAAPVSVNLELAREVEVRMQLRQAITDLPVGGPGAVGVQRAEGEAPPRAAPAPVELNIPQLKPEPVAMTVQPVVPREVPREVAESIALPQPLVQAEKPNVNIQPGKPVRRDEQQPAPPATGAPRLGPGSGERAVPAAAVEEVHLAAGAVLPEAQSIARMVVPRGAAPAPTENPGPRVEPGAQVQVVAAGPRTEARPVASDQPGSVQVAEPIVQSARLPTQSPGGSPSGVSLAIPVTRSLPGGFATQLAVTTRPAPASPAPARVAVDVPAAVDGPEIRPPVLAGPGKSSEEPVVGSAVEGAAAMRPLPLSAIKTEGPRNVLEPLGQLAPSSPSGLSPARPGPAIAGGRRAGEASADRIAPALSGLPPDLPQGRLSSPESLFQRSLVPRRRLIDEMGGSKESEAAVGKALQFLAREQNPDGRWSQQGKGRKPEPHDVGVTGLATLCFLAADHTPAKSGPYQQEAKKAIEYLLNRQKADGDSRGGGDMYDQAIATLTLAEAAVMTGEDRYAQAARKGADFILKAQNAKTGGWRYNPRIDGDTSVLGWQIMALHSVEALGFHVPQEARRGAVGWLDSVSKGRSLLAGYQGRDPTPSMTAEAVFSRILLGEELTQAQKEEVSGYLMDNPPQEDRRDGKGIGTNYYYWYYGTLAMMHMRSDSWDKWNENMRDLLVRVQRRSGDQDGSWEGTNRWDIRGGRTYATALATLTLEVYYRYLPMYKRSDREAGK